ncbi:uncharacterized protein LOC142351795 [Convolutriloba macropyga]|uniref:uncharacterized protein LOC142351795 n=1 Tax=Convolutriloba macropyga TaxID=536237 RepID=UPI003F51BDCA
MCEPLTAQERQVLGKLDEQDLQEMLRRQGLKKQYDRRRGMVQKQERQWAPGDLETDYERTYKAHYNHPMRASRRPLATPRDSNPPRGDFVTQTAIDFVPKPVHAIELVKKSDTYRPASAKVEGQSQYMYDYPAKSTEVYFAKRPDLAPAGQKIKAKFDGRTMHKEHFKSWVARESDKLQFRELDPVVDSIIFPKGEPISEVTETKQQFPGKYAPKPEAVKMAAPTVKLGTEGDFDHLTVNNATYKSTVGKEQKAINYKPIVKMPSEDTRGAFYGVTKYMSDYKDKDASKCHRGPMLPQPNNIAVDKDAKGIYDTWQRQSYKGFDVTKHKRPAEIRYDIQEYNPPTEKVDGVTVTKESFPKKDVALAYNPPKRTNVHERGKLPKFDSKTMNDEFFVPWPVQTRERFGDFKEYSAQVPVQGEFFGETTTGKVFTPKKYKKTEAFIPEQKPIAKEGDHDFNTVHRTTYTIPKYLLNDDEYAILDSALKKVVKCGGARPDCWRSRSVVVGA